MIQGNLRATMAAALKANRLRLYLAETRGWSTDQCQVTMPKQMQLRWSDRIKWMKAQGQAAMLTKLMSGWLASRTVLAKRQADVTIPGIRPQYCRLCKEHPETNWHILSECTHPAMVTARMQTWQEIKKVILSLQLPQEVAELLGMPWLLWKGQVPTYCSDQHLLPTLQTWAPALHRKYSSLISKLQWTTTIGTHQDRIQRWNTRGLFTEHWDDILSEMGAPPCQS